MESGTIKTIKAICLIVLGGISVICGVLCYAADTGVFERQSAYGGDAYTGIQNAGAATANNVKCVAQVSALGFGSILLIAGLLLILHGALLLLPQTKSEPTKNTERSSASLSSKSTENQPVNESAGEGHEVDNARSDVQKEELARTEQSETKGPHAPRS